MPVERDEHYMQQALKEAMIARDKDEVPVGAVFVFEEKVIAAVEDWTYRISFADKPSGDVIVTQKVEVQWKNYPQNLPNVD